MSNAAALLRPGGGAGMSLTPRSSSGSRTALAASPERWRHLIHHADDVRVYEQIWDDEDVNAWVICWSEDQDTGFHDHDDSAAGDRGDLRAGPRGPADPGRRAALARARRRRARSRVPPVAIHRVLHAGDGPAVTIHAYSPPLRRTGAYRIGPDGELSASRRRSRWSSGRAGSS